MGTRLAQLTDFRQDTLQILFQLLHTGRIIGLIGRRASIADATGGGRGQIIGHFVLFR